MGATSISTRTTVPAELRLGMSMVTRLSIWLRWTVTLTRCRPFSTSTFICLIPSTKTRFHTPLCLLISFCLSVCVCFYLLHSFSCSLYLSLPCLLSFLYLSTCVCLFCHTIYGFWSLRKSLCVFLFVVSFFYLSIYVSVCTYMNSCAHWCLHCKNLCFMRLLIDCYN